MYNIERSVQVRRDGKELYAVAGSVRRVCRLQRFKDTHFSVQPVCIPGDSSDLIFHFEVQRWNSTSNEMPDCQIPASLP